ncbi:MAG: ATP-binding protein [Alphaproteobacteria bacterium]|nr:ATP-binding protein [Alphaproteobacteria bacterium]
MTYPRFLTPRLLEAAQDTPLLLLKGARQVGKSTLMQELISHFDGHSLSLDDPSLLSLARQDPRGFIDQVKTPVLLDEVQRAPELTLPIKLHIDRNRRPGQFFLTGSADFHTLPMIADSMAGRIEIRTLWPLSQGEINRKKERFLKMAFGGEWPTTFPIMSRENLYDKVIQGGYPEALARKDSERRAIWFDSYLEAIIQRDIRQISSIEGFESIPNLLTILGSRAANLMNAADISRSLGLSQTTVKRYIDLLQSIFIIFKLKPWFSNIDKRLVKTPKVYFVDSGFLSYLLRLPSAWNISESSRFGQVLENFVVAEILKQCSWEKERMDVYHFRTQNGEEVDVILQDRKGRFVGVEVKSSSTVSPKDFKGLISFKEITKENFCRGIVLYTGDAVIPYGENLWAIPLSALWE